MIEKRIKEKFGTKAKFCAKCGHKPKELATKLRTLQNKIKWANDFLAPLGLSARVLPTDEEEMVKTLISEQLDKRQSEQIDAFLSSDVADAPVFGIVTGVNTEGLPVGGQITPDDLIGEELTGRIKNTTGKDLPEGAAVAIDEDGDLIGAELMPTPSWCRSRGGCTNQFCRSVSQSGCSLDCRPGERI